MQTDANGVVIVVGRLLLLLLASAASAPVPGLGHLLTPAGLSTAAGDLAARAATLLVGWMLLTVLAAQAARLPGRLAVPARVALRLLAPRAARAAVLGLAGAQALVTTAVAAGPSDVVDAGTLAVQRPAVAARDGGPPPGRPSAAASPPPAAPTPAVVVGPGDSLWGIAARTLPAGAPDAAVAATWPAWYLANREVIGPDPDLLRVGTVLHPPAQGARVTR